MCKFRNVTLRVRTLKMKRRAAATLPMVREESPRFNRDLALYGTVVITAVLSYINSLNGEFVHDDIPAVVMNPDVIGTNSLRKVFENDFWGTPMSDVNSHKSYRPLTTLSFRLNHVLSGLKPWWYHASNVVLHAICCALVARACVTVARLQRPFALLAALLFAVHPVHTEAVAGIVGRADVLACILFLSSLLLYHRPAKNKKCVWLSIMLGALSMLAKETGFTILVLNLVFDLYRCWPFMRKSLSTMKMENQCTRLIIRVMKVTVSLALLISVRLAVLQGSWPTFSNQDNPAAFHPNFFVRLMTFCYLAAFNWWLLLCPWTLSHDWQMSSVPIITSAWDPRNLLTCAALGAMLLLCYRCVADMQVQRHTPAVIGLMILVISFLPASNMFVTVGFVIAERVLYIPSVGSVIITAYGAQLMWCSKPGAKAFIVVGFAVLAASSVAKTYKRNADWRDRASLLRADLVTLPENAKLHYNFGNFLRETDQHDGAIHHYKEAIRLWPTYASAHNNIGTLVNSVDNAEEHFLQAIKYNRGHVNAHYNLAKLYKKSGHKDLAIRMLEKCNWLQPHFILAHLELMALKPPAEQPAIMQRIIRVDPENWEHYLLFGKWLKNKGIPAAASKLFIKAVRLSFKHRAVARADQMDLLSVRSAALMYRSMGQKGRILQLLTRWHTWRRGWYNAATTHMYLREWRLKMELEGRVRIYSEAVSSSKSTTCFDHNQLSVKEKKANEDKKQNNNKLVTNNKDKKPNQANVVNNKKSDNKKNSVCVCKTCGTKQKNVSISSQLKNIHNKSDAGLKAKTFSKVRKDKKVTKTNVIPSIGAPLEHITIKMI
ncbi:protein O-mannosyl-transferase TMTC1-like [Leguminivora glycinivorella]|uniref:protein O-mannosyl-transferase TMTC1-like n=1 Tax=Leguminivora glycinivorella TaxID=1035111 RepID=UPI00200C5E4E|nr:protein O-mannosyl-transferase TMTC1-like [Leguminivora glycinivorella]